MYRVSFVSMQFLTNVVWVSMKFLGSLKYQASITVMVSYILDRKETHEATFCKKSIKSYLELNYQTNIVLYASK